ncbi:hypothetical protein HDU97_006203 [Phlyctochytrium planicorne]|nr:hypothetical protein HDU97_006203 [Phlyctochytrium planicorne]
MQGINWQTCPITREEYRKRRIANLQNYINLEAPNDEIIKDFQYPRTDGFYYRFNFTNLKYKCSWGHFQLRNLVWATSINDVYYNHDVNIMHWCPQRKAPTVFLRTSPSLKISTMSAGKGFLFVGGLAGDFYVKRLEKGGTVHFGKITTNPNGITNHAEINETRSGGISDFLLLFTCTEFPLPWAVNCSVFSPDKRLVCIVGDDKDASVFNTKTGQLEFQLRGHIDYSFACAWSPCGRYVATGNQDVTTRIYDLRNYSKAITVLPGTYGAIRSLRFTDDGKYLAAAEPSDFVHIYDVTDPGYRCQVIDFFGDISGISFSPDGAESFFIGNSDITYGSVCEFKRDRDIGVKSIADMAF